MTMLKKPFRVSTIAFSIVLSSCSTAHPIERSLPLNANEMQQLKSVSSTPRSGTLSAVRIANLLDKASERHLLGVHPDLVAVVRRAAEITHIPFRVTEGARNLKRQKELLKQGATTTLNSRHIPGPDGWAKAIDLVALTGGEVSWDWQYYHLLAVAMKAAAKELQIDLEWGGDWKTFKDGPHFQPPLVGSRLTTRGSGSPSLPDGAIEHLPHPEKN
jgi:hypothetical protein